MLSRHLQRSLQTHNSQPEQFFRRDRSFRSLLCGAPSGRMFQGVKVPNPPDSGKDIAKSKGSSLPDAVDCAGTMDSSDFLR